MCLSLAACGIGFKKSEAVMNVESMLAELPDLSMEYYEETTVAREKIEAVKVAYDALSDKEKEKVENWQTYETERVCLFEREYGFAANFIQYMNLNSDFLVSANVIIWDNVGASDFFDYRKYVMTAAALGYDAMEEDYHEVFWAAGYAFDKEYFSKHFDSFSSSKISETEENCKVYAESMSNIQESQETTQALIDVMMEDYSDEYSSKMDALQDWWIESSLYADIALTPDGSLNSYSSTVSTYQENIQRYQKVAGY